MKKASIILRVFTSIIMFVLLNYAVSGSCSAQKNIDDFELFDALSTALSNNDYKTAGLIIDRKPALLEIRNLYSCSLLDKAIIQRNLKMVRFLMSKGAKVNDPDRGGNTALHKALEMSSNEIISFLISKSADVNKRNAYGETPLFYARSLKAVKMLVKSGAKVKVRNNYGATPLFEARNGKIAEYFISKGLKVNDMDNDHCSPLHRKDFNFKNSIKILPGSPNNEDLFPPDDLGVIRVLIENGADVNLKDNKGKTPLHYVNDEKIAEILVKSGADVNIRDDEGSTPLFDVSNEKIAEILIDGGAEVNIRNNDGDAPLHTVRNARMTEVLLDRGAEINAGESSGNTLLHSVSERGDDDILKLLITKGANIHITNNQGDAPLDILILRNSLPGGNPQACILLLLSHGASPRFSLIVDLIKRKNWPLLQLLFLHSPILWAKLIIPLFLLILLVKLTVFRRINRKES